MPTNPLRHHALSSAFALLALLSACGGGGGSGESAPAPPPPPPVNQAPLASFTAVAGADADSPVVLDARASSDPEGGALSYRWSFGDSALGSGAQAAHRYAASGSYTVRLTVQDPQGNSSTAERSVTIAAGPAPAAMVNTLAIVRGLDGALLQGVTVTPTTGGATGTTGADGRAVLQTGTGVKTLLKFSKAGYADQFRNAGLPAGATDGYVEVTMQPREAALTLPDAAAGGTLTGKDGATLTLPANALVDAAGNPVTGPVSVAMTPVDVATNPRAFPGRFEGLRSTGLQGLLLSYGTVEYVLSNASGPLQLAPGRKATIDIPIYTALHRSGTPVKLGDSTPLWTLDERTGGWAEEGSGTVVAASSPSGFALRAEVQHFSWWNCDDFLFPPARPKPKCMVDTNADGVLEDLTGTGHCWHAGTGPEQPPRVARGDVAQALAVRPRAVAVGSVRVPAFMAYESTPAAGGVTLPIPGDMDITFRSTAKNGTLFGMKVVNMPGDSEAEVIIELTPVQANPGTLAVTLPYDQHFRSDVAGQTDRFTFAADANASYQVTVTPVVGSTLGGTVRVLAPGGTQLNGGSFSNAVAFTGAATATTAGTITVEVLGQTNAPGAYRIELRRLAAGSNCANPQTLALPGTAANFTVPANNGLRCLTMELAADDVLEIRNTQNLNSQGTIALVNPGGVRADLDTYGTGVFDGMLLRVAIAQAGTWRLEITNERSTTGTITGLQASRLSTASTMALPGSAGYTGAADGVNERYHVLKPATAAPELAVVIDNKTQTHTLRVYPGAMTATGGGMLARVLAAAPGLYPLLAVSRPNVQASWDYTLASSLPLELPLDTTLAATANGRGVVGVYRLPAAAGQELTIGLQTPPSLNVGLDLFVPNTGAAVPVPTAGVLHTLTDSGTYTVVLRNNSNSSGNFTFRVNTPLPAEAVTLGAPMQRSSTLLPGELRRYGFSATQGQVLTMALSTPQAFNVAAVLMGVPVNSASLLLSNGPVPRSTRTAARYVQQAGAGEIWVYAAGNSDTNASGSYTVELQSPAPLPATLGTLLSVTPEPARLVSYSYTVASAGNHLLCTRHSGNANNAAALDARVWGPSAPFSNYVLGDIANAAAGAEVEGVGFLRAGTNTLSLLMNEPAATPAQLRLVPLAPAVALTLGAAASPGTLSPCQRAYYSFAGVAGQSYTVRTTAEFAGSLRLRKLVPNGDVTARTDPPFSTNNLGNTPLPLVAGVERVLTFTIPTGSSFGNGTYVIEVDADADAAGSFSLSLATP